MQSDAVLSSEFCLIQPADERLFTDPFAEALAGDIGTRMLKVGAFASEFALA